MFHTIVSIKNDGHYFCRAGGNRPDGLNEPVTNFPRYQSYVLKAPLYPKPPW
nr:copper resistance protein [Escherichia coli]